MARYTDESRERVRDAVDFAELVGARTELRAAGTRRLSGLCPFHDERTPSFGIDPVEKVYHCFGCGAGGDVFKFVMETEGLDFVAALESLADRFGIELEREAEDPRAAQQRVRRDRLLALLERTAAFYVRVLWEGAEAARAREYLVGRGLSEAVLREFRVGYAPSAWDKVLTASQRAGFTVAELFDAGLLVRGRSGRPYDRFRGRITFPLADERGRVRGFGARALREGQGPKYLNSAEGDVFHKGQYVYGAGLARAAAAREGRVVLVEGYTDAIAFRQAGVENVVGSMGTALTEVQAEALKRLAPAALLCLDADAAGVEAMMRAAAVVRTVNARSPGRPLDLRIVPLPRGTDPADLAGAEGAEGVRARLDASVPFARFQVEQALDRGEVGSAEGRDRVIEALRPVFAGLGDGAVYQELLRHASDRLDTTAEILARLLPPRGASTRIPRDSRQRDGDAAEGPWRRFERTESDFLARCLAVPDKGRQALAEADVDTLFASDKTRRAARHLLAHFEHPGEGLPAGDDDFASLVAQLVIRAGELEGGVPALDLERVGLEKLRVERQLAAARRGGGDSLDLAVERQRLQRELDRLQSENLSRPLHRTT